MSGMFVESLSIAVIRVIIINYQRFMSFLINHGFPKGGYSIGSCSRCKSCAERVSSPMVSKQHPQGKVVFTALQKGLGELRQQGLISRALKECGMIYQRVSNWKVTN
ncbi:MULTISPECIES: hypothetical protein [unclassified Agarivorans]|uniref:hypothetical protein n=1 Tax=unclassified Agarivorans TaxID=2636026 RepID=UPI003D7CD4D7